MQLEKEAVTKGVAPGQAHEIDIPPPRPKRKPSCPYPRKSKGYSVNFQPLTVDFSKPKGLVPALTTSREAPRAEDAFPEVLKNNSYRDQKQHVFRKLLLLKISNSCKFQKITSSPVNKHKRWLLL